MKYSDYYLKKDPFQPVFKESMIDYIDSLIVGREDEIENIKDLLISGNSVFLNGIYGVGKTILTRKFLQEIEEENFFTVYVNGYYDNSVAKNILKSLIHKIEKENFVTVEPDESSHVLSMLVGDDITISENKKRGLDKVLRFGSEKQVSKRKHLNIDYFIDRYIKKVKDSGRDICIAIDNLDFDISSVGEIPKLVVYLRKNFIEKDISVAVTGHPMGVLSAFGSHSDILVPIHIPTLKGDEMKLMIKRYLLWQRMSKFKKNLGEFFPFDEDLVNYVVSILSELKLSARIAQNTFKMILNYHKTNDIARITFESLRRYWELIISKSISELKPEDQKVYKIILETGGIVEPENYELRKKLGGTFHEYSDIIKKVYPLFKNNILIQEQDSFKINPILRADLIKSFD